MAEFCTKCSKAVHGDAKNADINIPELFERLEEGYMEDGFICEGCGMVMIAKMGKLLIVGKVKYDDAGKRDYSEEFEDIESYL